MMLLFLNYWISDLPKKSASFCIKNIPEFALGKFLPAAVMSHAYQLQVPIQKSSPDSKIVPVIRLTPFFPGKALL